MLERDSFFKNERYLGYLMGAGVILMILALLLEGLGTIENGATTGSIFVIGLALFLLGLLTWLYMFRPWKRFDDLKTPHYTGEHTPDKAAPEAAHEAAPEAEHAAEAAAPPARSDVPATVPSPKTAIEPHVIHMPGPKAEAAAEVKPAATVVDAAKAAAEAVKDTAKAAVGAAESVAEVVAEAGEEVAAAPSKAAASIAPDDLTIIEGIGPKTNSALQAAGVSTFAALAEMTPDAISALLSAAKVRIVSPPDTWPQQAKLAAKGDMDGLATLQARLKGGLLKD